MSWVSLHNHTDGSVLDGACSIDRLIDRAIELQMPAVGITDHGNMIKSYEFYTKCTSKGIKPIIGCEFYVGEPESKDAFHLVVIAKNNTGLTNLYKLNAYSFKDNFYRKPRISFDKLIELHEGLIVTTACIGSIWGQASISKTDLDLTMIANLRDVFVDDFYLEIQPNTIPEQKNYNEVLTRISTVSGVPLVVGGDVHYVLKEDFEAHDTMLAMQTKKKKNDPKRFRFSANDYYLKTRDEINSELVGLGISQLDVLNALNNTVHIADKCSVTMEPGQHLPMFSNMDRTGASKLLREHVTTRYWTRYDKPIQEVIDRIFYELGVIEDKGYAGYFLIVEDFIDYAKDNGILIGPGRGSASGCMLSYILGITDVDPIEHGLLFHRFLNPDRDTSVDIDIDVDYELRHLVVSYVKDTYGEDHVAQVMAEGTLAPMAVLRRVMGVFDHPQRVISQVSATIRGEGFKSVTDAYRDNSAFRSFMDKYKEEYKAMQVLEGLMSHTSTHAAGLIITTEPIYELVPCDYDRELGLYRTQWHKKIVEGLGFYKFDLLGLKTLSVIRKTKESIYKNYGADTAITSMKECIYDQRVYEHLRDGNLTGIFQFDKAAGSEAIHTIKPTSFEEVVAATALCRPGVVEAQLYYANKELHDKGKAYPVPEYWELVKDILEPTYGTIVYQEQTMLLMNRLTGNRWTLGKADSMRKVKDLEEFRKEFIFFATTSEQGLSDDLASAIYSRFDMSYSFNKSHAVAYSYISCYCAYLKMNFPKEFYAALMTIENLSSNSNLVEQIREVKALGVPVLPPDIRVSRDSFVPTEQGIRYPLTAIKGVGDKVTAWLDDNIDAMPVIQTGTIHEIMKFVPKRVFNKRVMTNLIKAGAFDYLEQNRSMLLGEYFRFRQEQYTSYTWGRELSMSFEKEVLGTTLTHHPLDGVVIPRWHTFKDGDKAQMTGIIQEINTIQDKNDNTMAFVKVANKHDTVELVIFSYVYKQIMKLLHKGNAVVFQGDKDKQALLVRVAEVM